MSRLAEYAGPMIKKVKNLLLYAGLDNETNQKYKHLVLQNDIYYLKYYLIIAGSLFLLLGLASVFASGFAHKNTMIYFSTGISLLILLLLQQLTLRCKGTSSVLNRLYIYLFMAALYIEAISLTIMHKSEPAVTYIGVLLILPLLFAQYPLPMILFQGCFVGVFCVFTFLYKDPDVAAIDIWNGVTFYFVSIIAVTLVIPMRFNKIIQPQIIRELSERDMLTGLKNRNSFEIFCGQLRRKGTGFLCVYADANGLHELNNTYGHEAGDNMLRSVAKVMQGQFGSDNVYRIGGDEFVAFSLSTDGKQFCSRTEVIKKELSEMGYHLSIGCAGSENDQQTVDEIIKKAEAAMFKDKASYYLSGGKDRRHR